MANSRRPTQVYAFVDTNIFLDFYRSRTEASLSLLRKLETVRDRIICTYQVEMEFLKHRQEQILKIYQDLDLKWTAKLPAVLAESRLDAPLRKTESEIKKRKGELEKRIKNLLANPSGNDPVFKALQAIFDSKSDHVLTRDMAIRHKIKRLAWRRFILGYPPRKDRDTSIGDALNWEWLVDCGTKLPGRFIIVSRDSDYGCDYEKESYLNDALKHEFRDRVGKKSISYTTKLSAALRALEIHVTPAEEASEDEAAKAGHASRNDFARLLKGATWPTSSLDRQAAINAMYPDFQVQFPDDEGES